MGDDGKAYPSGGILSYPESLVVSDRQVLERSLQTPSASSATKRAGEQNLSDVPNKQANTMGNEARTSSYRPSLEVFSAQPQPSTSRGDGAISTDTLATAGVANAAAPAPKGNPKEVAKLWHELVSNQRSTGLMTEFARKNNVLISAMNKYVKADGEMRPRPAAIERGKVKAVSKLWEQLTPQGREVGMLAFAAEHNVMLGTLSTYVRADGTRIERRPRTRKKDGATVAVNKVTAKAVAPLSVPNEHQPSTSGGGGAQSATLSLSASADHLLMPPPLFVPKGRAKEVGLLWHRLTEAERGATNMLDFALNHRVPRRAINRHVRADGSLVNAVKKVKQPAGDKRQPRNTAFERPSGAASPALSLPESIQNLVVESAFSPPTRFKSAEQIQHWLERSSSTPVRPETPDPSISSMDSTRFEAGIPAAPNSPTAHPGKDALSQPMPALNVPSDRARKDVLWSGPSLGSERGGELLPPFTPGSYSDAQDVAMSMPNTPSDSERSFAWFLPSALGGHNDDASRSSSPSLSSSGPSTPEGSDTPDERVRTPTVRALLAAGSQSVRTAESTRHKPIRDSYVIDKGRPLTVDDMQKWKDLPTSKQAKLSVKNWLAISGISQSSREYLKVGGITNKGQRHLAFLMAKSARYDAGKTYTRDEVSAASVLLKTLHYETLSSRLVKEALIRNELEKSANSDAQEPQTRDVTAIDFLKWKELDHQQRTNSGGPIKWLSGQGVVGADAFLTPNGISSIGYKYLDQVAKGSAPQTQPVIQAPVQRADDNIDVDNLTEQDLLVGFDHLGPPKEMAATSLPILIGPFVADISSLNLTKPGQQSAGLVISTGATGNNPQALVTLATQAVRNLTNAGTNERAGETRLAPTTKDIFKFLSIKFSGEANNVLSEELMLTYAKRNNLIDEGGRLTGEGASRLASMNKERQLLASLHQIKKQPGSGELLTHNEKRRLANRLARQNNVSSSNLQFYLDDAKALDSAIGEISKKWSD